MHSTDYLFWYNWWI